MTEADNSSKKQEVQNKHLAAAKKALRRFYLLTASAGGVAGIGLTLIISEAEKYRDLTTALGVVAIGTAVMLGMVAGINFNEYKIQKKLAIYLMGES